MHKGFPVPSCAQILDVDLCELFVEPKTTNIPMKAFISTFSVLYANPCLLFKQSLTCLIV